MVSIGQLLNNYYNNNNCYYQYYLIVVMIVVVPIQNTQEFYKWTAKTQIRTKSPGSNLYLLIYHICNF